MLTRAQRQARHAALRVPKHVEERYVSALKRAIRSALPTRKDAKDPLAKSVGASFDMMARGVARVHRGYQGVDVAAIREKNVQLISAATDEFRAQISDILSENEDAHPDEIADLISERLGVADSRAELIARDQTLKLNGAINQAKQTKAGGTEYIWSTSKDERVRPMHADLDGETFSWDDPPVTDDDGNTNAPGEDFQCRCIALFVEPSDDEDEEDT